MKYIYYLIIFLVLLWVGGLCYFIYNLSQSEEPSMDKTDGIVVLTGGRQRLQEGVRLLEKGMAQKMFISGVNADVTDAELRAALGSTKQLADCCIESGFMAQNTEGNAKEIALWVKKSHMTSIRVVTSLEHMPRALVEMRRFMPQVKIISHPVGQWRPENIRFASLVQEYSKLLVSIFRSRLLDLG